MKKYLLLLLIPVLLFTGCSTSVRTNILDVDEASLDSAMDYYELSAFSGVLMGVDEDSQSLVLSGGTRSNGLYIISVMDIPPTDNSGNALSINDLRPGDTMDITYDGGILETQPAMFSGVSSIVRTGHTSTLVPVYMDIIDIFGHMSENSGSSVIAIDLTGASNLSSAEKGAVVYLTGMKYEKDTFEATEEELKSFGYISDEGEFVGGALITIAVQDTPMDDGFEFSVSTWRGSRDAAGYVECFAVRDGGNWSYIEGSMWSYNP